MEYREDIQVLRGLAVLFVVLFHLQAPGFHSGFLGVDIFFVISGYLMAVMYDPARKREFFLKRAARLLPAYCATIFVTLLGAAFVTTPNDFFQVAHQALFGAAFLSNVGFWMENSYFDKSAFKPLLHLWSLSLEIQFYLLVPLVAGLCRRYRPGYALIALLSAGGCFLAVGVSPSSAFFLLPFRLWEFLLGFGVATWLGGRWQTAGRGKTIASSTALAVLVTVPLLALDGNALGFVAGHPGLHALIVSLACGTLLAFGLPRWAQAHPVSHALARLGTWSYSVYLAHFPVIVLFLYQPFSGTLLTAPDPVSALCLLGMIAACSALLFAGVEQPFRQRARGIRFSLAAAVLTVAAIPLALQTQSYLFPARERLIYEAWFDRDAFRCGEMYSLLHRGDVSCNLTPELAASAPAVLLVGNSHADAIKGTFLSVARSRGIAVRFIVQNTPLMAGGRVGVEDVVREARDKRVEAVVLHFSPGAVSAQTIGRLVAALAPHRIRVAYLLPIPVWQQSVPKMLINNITDGVPLPVVSSSGYSQRQRAFEDAVANLAGPGFRVYRTDQVFCRPVCQMLGENGRPYYFDDAHLTATGSEQLRPVITTLFDELGR